MTAVDAAAGDSHSRSPRTPHPVPGRLLAAAADQAALDLSNDSECGLSAAVFADNFPAVTPAVEQLDVAMPHINPETAGADPHVPSGRAEHSEFGLEEQQSRARRKYFTPIKAVDLRLRGSREGL